MTTELTALGALEELESISDKDIIRIAKWLRPEVGWVAANYPGACFDPYYVLRFTLSDPQDVMDLWLKLEDTPIHIHRNAFTGEWHAYIHPEEEHFFSEDILQQLRNIKEGSHTLAMVKAVLIIV